MPKWTGNKVNPLDINKGNQYELQHRVAMEQLNAVVNAGLYAQDFVENAVGEIDVVNDNPYADATVEVIDSPNATAEKPYKKIRLKNIKGRTGATGTTGTSAGYDLTIRTQEEFETWISQLNDGTNTAQSVLLVGNGGSLVYEGKIKLTTNVLILAGINDAKLNGTITGANNNTESFMPENSVVQNISIVNNGAVNKFGFFMLKNLINCHVDLTYTNSSITAPEAWGFGYCKNIVNCDAKVNGGGFAKGFWQCDNIVNCKSYAKDSGNGNYAFFVCRNIINSQASATGTIESYGFSECSYISNCREGAEGCSTSFLGGSNTFVDDITVG